MARHYGEKLVGALYCEQRVSVGIGHGGEFAVEALVHVGAVEAYVFSAQRH